MIVAARAGDREPQEGFRGGVDLLIDHVVDHLHAILLRQRLGTQRQESGGDNAALVLRWLAGSRSPASCSMNEAVVGQVVVEAFTT